MKRPIEGTGVGNAKKSKIFHPPQEEPITLVIDFNVIMRGSGQSAQGKRGNGRGQCR